MLLYYFYNKHLGIRVEGIDNLGVYRMYSSMEKIFYLAGISRF